jgi:anhydro-N-acetylmuramic acid kinase
MSGSSLDGLDLCYAHLQEVSGKWTYDIIKADCYAYEDSWISKLKQATGLSAREYLLLHVEYGHYLGQLVNRFIQENGIAYQVQLIASHGHTTFHIPSKLMTAQLGDGAAIAAETGINVVSDLRAMDLALAGQGAPIVPIGEKFLLGEFDFFLNLGGIANISANVDKTSVSSSLSTSHVHSTAPRIVAFDVCPANRVLNLLSNEVGKEYDDGGQLARSGIIKNELLQELNNLEYYRLPFPKSLANDFGTDIVYPIIKKSGCSIPDGLRTMTEHIVQQIHLSIERDLSSGKENGKKLLATGGGAFNGFLIERLSAELNGLNIEVQVPDENLVKFKEALVMALMGVLRWREENNVMSSVTGASRDSIGGAVWIGLEA